MRTRPPRGLPNSDRVGRIGHPASVNVVTANTNTNIMGVKAAGKEDQDVTSTSTIMSTHKWGQHHCGESCACVLRLDVTVDPSEGGIVTAARYTARSIMRSPATGRPYVSPRLVSAALRTPASTSSSTNSTTTTTNQKLFLTECTCPNLHRLAQKTCAYQLHKNMFQIMNNLYTSPPIKHYIARTHRLTQSPHCYDLVHATLHALWHQRLPPRLHTPTTATTTLFSSELDYNTYHHHYDHPYPAATTTANYFHETAAAATPERTSLSPWWRISSGNSNSNNNDENGDRTAAAAQRSSSSSSITDYYIRETLQQHLDRLDDNAQNGAGPGQRSTTTTTPLSLSRHKDWVAYVDEMQDSNDVHAMEYHRRWSKSA
jgi:hypothetical protein